MSTDDNLILTESVKYSLCSYGINFFCKNHNSDVFCRYTFNSILQKNKALRSTSHNQTLSRKEMNIKLKAAYYKISGIMQDRVYACKITGVDGTQATHL